jgi:hypothetical protein
MNITHTIPTHEELKAWHDKILERGTWADVAFFQWHIKPDEHARAASFIVERVKPIGGRLYFILHCKWQTIRE